MTSVQLIGLDWSTSESKRGIAVFEYSGASVALIELSACNSRRAALDVIAAAVMGSSAASLIAIDAPLGWPVGLSAALVEHSAGERLNVGANEMFSRDTDRFVRDQLGKTPLEVGANLIARTGHSANQFLRDLRKKTSRAIPLLWSPEQLREAGVIEVYPAGDTNRCDAGDWRRHAGTL
jgi:predicted RNase H-like nuclease